MTVMIPRLVGRLFRCQPVPLGDWFFDYDAVLEDLAVDRVTFDS